MTARAAALAGALLLLSGCVYYNAIYNAQSLFQEGEGHRQQGRDSLAAARYAEVVRKTADGFRRDPEGAWADEALLLMGRAYLRLGELRAGRAALEATVRRAGEEPVRLQALLHLGVAHVMSGDRERGAALLNEALRGLSSIGQRAEGHLWRGRVLLETGQHDVGWWDLDQAASQAGTRTDAALTRVAWGVRLDNPERAREGMNRLLSSREAGARVDTVVALTRAATHRWGPLAAAGLLTGADSARWERTPRGILLLARAGLILEAGDTARAAAEMRRVAGGLGPAADAARLALARWQLARARDLVEARSVLAILLPAVGTPEGGLLAGALQDMLELAERGLDEPLAWFAAGELGRDRLAAGYLAQGFFLAYADALPDDPWTAKALLAALASSDDPEDRAWLLGRLERRAESPYVLAARGEPALGLEALEEELARRLQEIVSR